MWKLVKLEEVYFPFFFLFSLKESMFGFYASRRGEDLYGMVSVFFVSYLVI